MSRALVACLIALGALALIAPATALAGGPSAGDQQYIDPLAGSSHHGSSHPQTPSSSSSASTAPATVPAATSSTPSGTSSTISSSVTSSSTARDPSNNLPMTGFDALLAAIVGACLLASGALLLRATRSG